MRNKNTFIGYYVVKSNYLLAWHVLVDLFLLYPFGQRRFGVLFFWRVFGLVLFGVFFDGWQCAVDLFLLYPFGQRGRFVLFCGLFFEFVFGRGESRMKHSSIHSCLFGYTPLSSFLQLFTRSFISSVPFGYGEEHVNGIFLTSAKKYLLREGLPTLFTLPTHFF